MYLHVFVAILAVAGATPAAKPNAFCSTVDKIVTKLNQQSAATAFCSSYLSISVHTSTATTHSTTSVTVTTVTSTSLATETQTSTATVTSTVLAAGGCTPTAQKKRSAVELEARHKDTPQPQPSCFSSYTAGGVLSSACSCLSIPASTTTSTSTSTVTSSVTATAIVGSTTTVTTTSTSTVNPTSTNFLISDGQGNFLRALNGNFNTPLVFTGTTPLTGDTFQFISGCSVEDNAITEPLVAPDAGGQVVGGPGLGNTADITCYVDPITNALTCQDPNGDVGTYECPSDGSFYVGANPNECGRITPTAVPV